ncbi:P2Y purinoceptor 3-like [Acanthochromis polyacanthus]|uniref:P2Y purinoceptor 3-like n=1 Tax=Acanthochromis polyacanthus TaxID=80966 RepID=UPI000B8F7D7F|nr:P2Y purinoceptor 3-like [Acanthochromis polyacanthus]
MDEPKICPVTSFYQRILLPASYSLVFLLGLALNGALLWRLRFRARRACSTVIYMTNLAVADLLYVLALPLLIISNSMGDMWPFGNIICKSVRFFFLVNLHCSVMFLTCVSVHRFLGVCHPIVSVRLRTKKLALYTSACVWILANAEVIPTLVFTHTGVINNMTVCFEMTNPGGFNAYFPYGLFSSLAFLIEFLVTVTCYCAMIRTLGVTNCISNVKTARMRKRSLHTLLVVSVVFVVCFLPYHIARTVYLFVRAYTPLNCSLLNVAMICYKVWKPVVSLNCCANPLLYFCGSGRHRQRLRAWLWRRKRRIHPSVCPVDAESTKRSAD